MKAYSLLVFYSLALTSIVSSLISLGLMPWTKDFKSVFFIATALQFIIFFIVNSFLQRREVKETLILQKEQEAYERELESRDIKIRTSLMCAYCKTPDNIIVNLSKSENYTCEYCKQENRIKVQIIPTQVVKPVQNIPSKIIEAAESI